jgi:hypothetical protein
MTWEEIDKNWGDIFQVFQAKLPFHELVDFDDDGSAITCNRPMGESIIVARVHRLPRFQHYLVAAGLETASVGPRIINVIIGERVRIGSGGRGKVG